jgi:sucrose-6F-phosphate phosphohydrolase
MNESNSGIRLFATDIDDTLIGDAKRTGEFKLWWESLDADQRPLLVYNTGRSIADTQWLVLEGQIPKAEFIIGAIGTEMFDPVDESVADAYLEHIGPGWDASTVRRMVDAIPGVRIQGEEFLNPHKLSWHWPCATAADLFRLEFRLKEAGLDVLVHYSSNIFLDVIPRRAGKGNALTWLCGRIGMHLSQVLVAGASANNAPMFRLSSVHGLLIGNSSRDLFAATRTAQPLMTGESRVAGVIDGLRQHGVYPRSVAAVPVAAL